MKKLLLLSMLILASCSKDEIQEEVPQCNCKQSFYSGTFVSSSGVGGTFTTIKWTFLYDIENIGCKDEGSFSLPQNGSVYNKYEITCK